MPRHPPSTRRRCSTSRRASAPGWSASPPRPSSCSPTSSSWRPTPLATRGPTYVVNASFGAIVAIIDGLALWAIGVPAPVVWAILAFVTNFIPNIGFVLGLVPPAVLAFVVGGLPLMLAVIAIYSIVNVVLQVLVQPKFVSDTVDLSLTLSFFSVVFWTFVIGPLGAILSIPLTLLFRDVLLDRDPGARWLRWLSGDARVPEDDGRIAAGRSQHTPGRDP